MIMKKLAYFFRAFVLVLGLLTTLATYADVTINSTNFPDDNFRSYLLSLYPSGTITTAQINALTELNVSNKMISNMKGVEYFTELTYLNCYSNKLNSIDVTQNTKLTYLNVGYNNLTSLSVSQNTELEQLYLQGNKFTSFAVTGHSKLRTFWIFDNYTLTSLTCNNNVLTNFDVRGCTALTTLRCFENANLSTIQGLANCTAITYLDCEDCAITDLTAVNSMTRLETLLCRNNKLTTLTLTDKHYLKTIRANKNTLLTKLDCYGCALTSFNITDCTALKELNCNTNTDLTVIGGLSTCTALQELVCYCCALTDLTGVNNMSNLQRLVCSANNLTSLTINNKPNLWQLWVDDNDLLTRLDCNSNKLSNLNVAGCTQLDSLNCRANSPLTKITGLEDCTNLRSISCNSCAITDLDGLRGKASLERVSCSINQLSSMDFTGCNSLNYVICVLNEILEDGMQTMVNSLPVRPASSPGTLIAMYDGPDENNDMTEALAVEAFNKNWGVYAAVGSGIEPIVSLDKALNTPGGDIQFTTGGDYPWKLVADNGRIYAISGNAGVPNSTSTLTATVNVTTPNVSLMSSFQARGEGTSPIYDKCQFSVDGVEVYAFGSALGDGWNVNNEPLSLGRHTLTWTYTKDDSVNPAGDYFGLDEVYLMIYSVRGDVNSDGVVNINDVTSLIDYLLSGYFDGFDSVAADCNQDSNINISDLTTLIDYLLRESW